MEKAPESEVVHREIDSNSDEPQLEIVELIAEIEGRDETDLPPMYECVDGVLDNLFSTPPDPEAQMQIEFTYETYRITIDQNGAVTFVKTD